MPQVIKILVIDDDPSVLLSTVCYLEDEGYEVISAESAEAGLAMLEDGTVNVAVVDMRLPGMDGNDFIRAASKVDKDLKYIVLTGSAQYAIPTDVAELGVANAQVLKKPLIEMNKITDEIKRLLDRSE
ncbi:response regulator [Pseudomonadota bacterium]